VLLEVGLLLGSGSNARRFGGSSVSVRVGQRQQCELALGQQCQRLGRALPTLGSAAPGAGLPHLQRRKQRAAGLEAGNMEEGLLLDHCCAWREGLGGHQHITQPRPLLYLDTSHYCDKHQGRYRLGAI
jgi:hypothetical protein